jgi:hypothetical protein
MGVERASHHSEVLTDTEKDVVRQQLERLLASPFFSHSKRFPSFLHFVVEQTLAENAEKIKERTLGIEIFGRDASYDTASDPIVRVTAAEIRKRVAQYYQDPTHEQEMRISLPSGSYIPQFRWPRRDRDSELPVVDLGPAPPTEVTAAPKRQGGAQWPLIIALICSTTALLVVCGVLAWPHLYRSPVGSFWQPVLTANGPVLLCVADQLQYSVIVLRDASVPAHQIVLKDDLTAIVIDDLDATVKLAGLLQSNDKQYSLKSEGATTLNDLRHGPTIFIGAFDNAWTLRLTHSLRYHFANDSEMNHLWIVDSTAPGQPRWVVDRGVQMSTNNYRDYGIVARFTDSNTGKLAIIVAGVGRGGTRAAEEFLTDNADLAQLNHEAQAAGNKRNMEVVLSTQIIDGQPGLPKIEAIYFW